MVIACLHADLGFLVWDLDDGSVVLRSAPTDPTPIDHLKGYTSLTIDDC